MISKTAGIVLYAAGAVPRYGEGDDARSAPAGQKLIAFQLNEIGGNVYADGEANPTVGIDGRAFKPVPRTSGGDEWIVVAVPEASSALLRMDNGGFRQTLSLPDGKPGSDNIAVLARSHLEGAVHKKVTITGQVSNGAASGTVTMHARVSSANLDFWAPGHESVHAPDSRHALLTTDLGYTDPQQPGKWFGFDPGLLRLRLPNGQLLRPRNIARKNRIFNVFTVPAGFTRGTIIVGGSERIDGITFRIPKPVNFPVAFPAG
jgi:hypothetical protein